MSTLTQIFHCAFFIKLFLFAEIVAYQEFLCVITPLERLSNLNDDEEMRNEKKATGLTSEKKKKPEC